MSSVIEEEILYILLSILINSLNNKTRSKLYYSECYRSLYCGFLCTRQVKDEILIKNIRKGYSEIILLSYILLLLVLFLNQCEKASQIMFVEN